MHARCAQSCPDDTKYTWGVSGKCALLAATGAFTWLHLGIGGAEYVQNAQLTANQQRCKHYSTGLFFTVVQFYCCML